MLRMPAVAAMSNVERWSQPPMPVQVTAEKEFLVGQATVVEGAAPEGPYVAVFEDDESAGYF